MAANRAYYNKNDLITLLGISNIALQLENENQKKQQ